MLSALLELGAVRKRADKRYEPLRGLRLLEDADAHHRERVKGRMPALCLTTDCTVECDGTLPGQPNGGREGFERYLQRLEKTGRADGAEALRVRYENFPRQSATRD